MNANKTYMYLNKQIKKTFFNLFFFKNELVIFLVITFLITFFFLNTDF